MVFSDSRCQDCPYTGIVIGSYILFYQGLPIDYCTHVTGTVTQFISESEYNAACTAIMVVSHFRIINNELTNKYLDVVPEQAAIILLDFNASMCMAKNENDTKHTRHISSWIYFVRNVE